MWTNLRHYLGNCLNGLKRITKIFQLGQPVPGFRFEPRTSPDEKEYYFPLDSMNIRDDPIPIIITDDLKSLLNFMKQPGNSCTIDLFL